MFGIHVGTGYEQRHRSYQNILHGVGVIASLVGLWAVVSDAQVSPIRPADSLKVPALQDVPRSAPNPDMSQSAAEGTAARPEASQSPFEGGLSYDPSGRRDPFLPIVTNGEQAQGDVALPPLQRVGLTELNLIGIIWGTYGYTAMVQTPDGKGYSIRRGTRVGPNNGVVSSITDRGIIVQERFTDVYGNKQEREYVKLLHPKEGIE